MQAAANAKENLKMSKLNLYISECYADEAPKLKRFTHGYKGRSVPPSLLHVWAAWHEVDI